MTADQTTVRAGGLITYTVTMTNHGPDDAIFVDTGFQLPDQLVLVEVTCDLGISSDTPFCEYSNLPAGVTVVSKLVAKIKPVGISKVKKVTVTASIFFETENSVDPDLSNSSTSVTTSLVGKP